MNYYNPYFMNNIGSNVGLFRRLFGNFKLSSILNGANKTLNFVNQTIPVIKQISPMVKNAKTMFGVIKEFRKSDGNIKSNINESNDINHSKKNIVKNSGPTFFL